MSALAKHADVSAALPISAQGSDAEETFSTALYVQLHGHSPFASLLSRDWREEGGGEDEPDEPSSPRGACACPRLCPVIGGLGHLLACSVERCGTTGRTRVRVTAESHFEDFHYAAGTPRSERSMISDSKLVWQVWTGLTAGYG